MVIKQRNDLDILTCAASLADQPYTLFFDSNRPAHPESKWSFLCWNPIEIITSKNGVVTHNEKEIGDPDIFEFIEKRLSAYEFEKSDIPFTGGIAGYWGYDLGRQIEDLPNKTEDDLNLPDMAVGIYTNVIAHDHQQNQTWFIGEELQIQEFKRKPTPSLNWQSSVSESDYKKRIHKAIEHIYAGDIYQVNLSRRFDANIPDDFNSFDHYLTLREINPAPFAAYMNFGEFQLSSCSPERFLKCESGTVETKPIKGTLPSNENPEKLSQSAKDIAENTMIVDLLRNDLSKVCDYHSVKTPNLCEVETFEGLHHLVSTVTGNLKENYHALDLLKACFPGGSITGAPKIRAMEIIEELEDTKRGSYCGAMGYIGFDGRMDTNIIIRTLIYANNKAYLQTGSGIVSDSTPEKELQESLDKAAKIFESFEIKKEEAA